MGLKGTSQEAPPFPCRGEIRYIPNMSTDAAIIHSPQGAASPSEGLLRHYTKLLVLCTAFLVFKGALVTSNGAGMAVPDWPQTFGQNLFLYPPSQWTGGVYYEHVHRLVASAVGLLTMVLGVWTWWVERRRWVRLVAYAMFVAVVLQGLLGGLTVLYGQPAWISSAHGVLGQTFFALTCLMAYAQSRELAVGTSLSPHRRAFLRGAWLLGLLYLQLIVGAVMRHTESGLALMDFPTMGGSYSLHFDSVRLFDLNQQRQALGFMPIELYQVYLHLAHRFGGFIVFGAVLMLFVWSGRQSDLGVTAKSTARFLWLLVCIQVLLGIFTVVSGKHPVITSFHVAAGAVMIGMTLLYLMRTYSSGVKAVG